MDRDDPYIAKSVDRGPTYGRNVPIVVTSNMSGGVGGIDVAPDGTIYVVIGETNLSTRIGHLFFAKSVDGGNTFSRPVVIDGHQWDEGCVCVGYRLLARYRDMLYVAWAQQPPDVHGQGVFLTRSTDRGVTWEAPMPIDSGSSTIGSVDVAVDDAGIVYVAWADGWVGKAWIAQSLDSGVTFGPSVVVSQVGWNAILASLAAGRAGEAYVLWSTILSPADYSGTLFLTRVVGGVPVLPPTQVTDVPANSTHVYSVPSVAVDGRGFVYAAWGDSRVDLRGDIYFARSIDGGRTFESNERVVDTPLHDGIPQTYADVATNLNGSVVVVWTDDRQDPDGGDIYSAVPTYLPDLSAEPSDISWAPLSPTEGAEVVVSATVRNVGWDASAATTARFYNGTPPAPQIGTDQPLPPLPINGSATVSVPWTAPPPGTYEVCVVADPDDTVAELNETNNLACRAITVVPTPLPDLALTPADIRLVPAPPVVNGTAVRVEATVHNSGNAASAPTVVRFYDGIPPAPRIGTDQPLSALAAGDSATVSATWTATPPGAHDVCVVVDPDDVVAESNEGNNTACASAPVLPPETRPDLVPCGALPASPLRVGLSKRVDLSLQVRNEGNASSNTTVLAFHDVRTPGTPLGLLSVPPLAPSEMSPRYVFAWTTPASPGTVRIVADVDYAGDQVEWNETNNAFPWTIDVVPGPATDLVVGTPRVTATETYVTSSTLLSFSVLDASETGVRNTTYRVDSGPPVNFTATGPFTLAGEGEHLVEWNSEDNAGNVEATRNATVRVDDTPPTTTFSLEEPKYLVGGTFVNGTTPVALAATDGGVTPVGLDRIAFRVWDGAWSAWTTYGSPFVLGGPDGVHYLEYRSADLLGNAEAVRNETIVLDTTPPETTLLPTTGPYTAATVFSLSPADAGSGVNVTAYSVDGGPWIPHTAGFTLAAGDHTIRYNATDHLGNREPVRTRVVRVEGPPPRETNWKPLVAAVFATVLALVGAWSSRRAPWPAGTRRRLRAFLLTALPFVAAEAATGVVSFFTGLLAIPSPVPAGIAVDCGILVAGIAVSVYRVLRRAPS